MDPARPTTLRIADVRSVWGEALEVPLGEVTVLVGPNRAGSSNVAWSLALALDPRLAFRPGRDLPRRRPRARPSVTVEHADGSRLEVDVGADGRRSGRRIVDGAVVAEPTDGRVVLCRADSTPRDLLRAAADVVALRTAAQRRAVAADLRTSLRRVLPEVTDVTISPRLRVEVHDDLGAALSVPLVRALTALGLVRHLAAAGHPPSAVVVEAPEALLHPVAQELMARELVAVAEATDVAVVATTTSPFVVPRTPGTGVVALARDAAGRTRVVGSAAGDEPRARLLGGLLRDPGLAGVLDRVGAVPADTRAVLIVEGGTDEAYLRLAAERLGRAHLLDGVVVRVAGGAMPAALAAVVLRAERDVPLLVLLDHDDNGRRARHTLVERFGFDRATQVVTYADVVHGTPRGVEAETLFDLGLLRRFVAEQGEGVTHGEQWLETTWHVELTGAGKSALVGWLERHARPEHLEGWDRLLDRLEERLP